MVVQKIVIGVVAAAVVSWWLWKLFGPSKEEETTGTHFYPGTTSTPIRYSNLHNNHDHLKVKHNSRDEALAEIQRMQRYGYEDSERLVEYYNSELDGWFVGRKKY